MYTSNKKQTTFLSLRFDIQAHARYPMQHKLPALHLADMATLDLYIAHVLTLKPSPLSSLKKLASFSIKKHTHTSANGPSPPWPFAVSGSGHTRKEIIEFGDFPQSNAASQAILK